MKKFFKKIVFIAVIAVLGGGIGYYFYHQQQKARHQVQIVDAQYERDIQDFKDIFERDAYWLLADPVRGYDVEHMLKKRAPNVYQPEYFGKFNIKVLFVNGKMAGFVGYYLKNSYVAQLLFIDIVPEFRRQGYARKLMNYAFNDLRKMGARRVKLLTRVDNVAQKLYKSMGYKEVSRDDKFVFFERDL